MPIGDTFTGLWSWGRGIYDLDRYLDLMKEWGYDTLFLWHDVVPPDAGDIVRATRQRGLDLVWGFSWGWDYVGTTPEEQRSLDRLLQRQGKRENELLCPSDPDSRKWARDFVTAKFEREYGSLNPETIYFQAFTEVAKCPCANCRPRSMGALLLDWVEPVAEDLLRRHPTLWISCGVHNSEDDFSALAGLDSRINILWERERPPNKAYPASGFDEAKELVSLRGEKEDVGLLFRLYGSFGLNLRGSEDAELHRRIDRNWDTIETGQGRIEEAQVYNLGWRRSANGWVENLNVAKLLRWMRIVAGSAARRKGLVALLEGSDVSYRPRFLPAIFGELARDPLRPDKEIEAALDEAWEKFRLAHGDP